MGRPTDNPKDTVLKAYFDKETAEKLDECIAELKVSKSEVVRRGIHRVHKEMARNLPQHRATSPSRLLPKGNSNVHLIPYAGFPFKQYRQKKKVRLYKT